MKNYTTSPNREVSSPLRQSYLIDNKNNDRLAKSSNLALFLNDLISIDQGTETMKERLMYCCEISLNEIFNVFDCNGRSSVSIVDFKEVLTDLDLYPDLEDLKLLYKRFDLDMDGKLSYNEFCNLLAPISDYLH